MTEYAGQELVHAKAYLGKFLWREPNSEKISDFRAELGSEEGINDPHKHEQVAIFCFTENQRIASGCRIAGVAKQRSDPYYLK